MHSRLWSRWVTEAGLWRSKASALLVLGLGFVAPLVPVPLSGPLWATQESAAAEQQAQSPTEKAATQSPEPEDAALARLQSALDEVNRPDLQAVAEGLGIYEVQRNKAASSQAVNLLVNLGDLDGDGIPEAALRWLPPKLGGQAYQEAETVRASWQLFLLAWTGAHWQASRLAADAEGVQITTVRLASPARNAIAVVTAEPEGGVPHPAIFAVKDHKAKLIWDGEADESRYRAYAHGHIEFRDGKGAASTEMIVTGRADPGLLVFPADGQRGFGATSVYRWEAEAYIPAETQYTANSDYTLYRFIAALHLHDFRAAYALTDPAKFLKADSPSLEKFRQFVEDSWPEFLDDQVFEALEPGPESPDPYAFALPERHLVYHPTFSEEGKFLLTSLERHAETAPAETPGNSP